MLIPLMLVLHIVGIEKSNAEIYQWTDENGKINFSDKLPESKVKNKKILKQDNPPSLMKGSIEDSQRKKKQAASWYKQRIEKSRINDIKIKREEKERAREHKIRQKNVKNTRKN